VSNGAGGTGATVKIIELSKSYETRESDDVRALDHIDLDIEPGSFVAVVGPSVAARAPFYRCLPASFRPRQAVFLLTVRKLGNRTPR